MAVSPVLSTAKTPTRRTSWLWRPSLNKEERELMEKKFDIKKFMSNNAIIILIALLALAVGFSTENFFSGNNLKNLIANVSPRFIIACGVSGCLITKGTDLSAGRQVGLAACLSGVLVQRGDYTGRLWKAVPEMNMWLVLLIVVGIGVCI